MRKSSQEAFDHPSAKKLTPIGFAERRKLWITYELIEVHFGDSDKESCWILMERIPGKQLDEAWPIMSETSKARTISEHKLGSRYNHLS
jgi:hypothetical protein